MTAVVRGHILPMAEPERFPRGLVTFVLNRDYWTVTCASETGSIKASTALSCIHRWLRNRVTEFHAQNLLSDRGRDRRARPVAEPAGLNVTRVKKAALGKDFRATSGHRSEPR
jgi:hypothetical protein